MNSSRLTSLSHKLEITKTILLNSRDIEKKRQEILNYFQATFSLYESIFECLKDEEAFLIRANPLRHPLIFYYGHTAVFFINKLNVAGLIHERIDPNIESTLAIGVDEMSWDDLNEAHYDWPRPPAVKAYRDKARSIIDYFIRNCDFTMPINWDSPMWMILMGIEQERIHLETTSILIRELPIDKVQAPPIWSKICTECGRAPENELLTVTGGKIILGKEKNNPLYGWDIEYGHKACDIAAFKASKYLVSNKEFLSFVQANGYQTPNYWTSEGWNWVPYQKANYPNYCVVENNKYRYRTMLKIIDMPWDWLVHINYLEAKAFCNWKAATNWCCIRR